MARTDPNPAPLPVRRALSEFGSHVQTWRKLRGLTQAQVADRAGVTRRTIIRIERGDGAVSVGIAFRTLHALGVLAEVPKAVDPYESDVGRLRADEQLPRRVRPRDLSGDGG